MPPDRLPLNRSGGGWFLPTHRRSSLYLPAFRFCAAPALTASPATPLASSPPPCGISPRNGCGSRNPSGRPTLVQGLLQSRLKTSPGDLGGEQQAAARFSYASILLFKELFGAADFSIGRFFAEHFCKNLKFFKKSLPIFCHFLLTCSVLCYNKRKRQTGMEQRPCCAGSCCCSHKICVMIPTIRLFQDRTGGANGS